MSEMTIPSWNSSTMCLQVLHRGMTEQGWDAWQPATPLRDYFDHLGFDHLGFDDLESELPKRPLDFGVGLWR